MSKDTKQPLHRLISVLESAGEKDIPPARAVAAAAAAISAIIMEDLKNIKE